MRLRLLFPLAGWAGVRRRDANYCRMGVGVLSASPLLHWVFKKSWAVLHFSFWSIQACFIQRKLNQTLESDQVQPSLCILWSQKRAKMFGIILYELHLLHVNFRFWKWIRLVRDWLSSVMLYILYIQLITKCFMVTDGNISTTEDSVISLKHKMFLERCTYWAMIIMF